jgi:hypothetical protein
MRQDDTPDLIIPNARLLNDLDEKLKVMPASDRLLPWCSPEVLSRGR